MIKKSWKLFVKTPDCKQRTYKSSFFRAPLVCVNTPIWQNAVSVPALTKAFLCYLPLTFVVCVYALSAYLVVFLLNLPLTIAVIVCIIIAILAFRHIAQCLWALSVKEVGFDPDFYCIDCHGEKDTYQLLRSSVVTPWIVILHFRVVDIAQSANPLNDKPHNDKLHKDKLHNDKLQTPAFQNNMIHNSPFSWLLPSSSHDVCKGILELDLNRSKSLVVTLCSMTKEDFRRLRVFLLAQK